MKAKLTERGFAGHFCASQSCLFHRNTLIEIGEKRIVVSTVGNYRPLSGKVETIGVDRYYETMAFEAVKEGVYWEADVSKQLDFESNWALDKIEERSDLDADLMHDAVVQELLTTHSDGGEK